MKILHIIPNLKKGGAERLVLDICNELQKREDVEVKLITFSSENEYTFLTNDIDWEVVSSSIQLSLVKKNKYQINQLQNVIEVFQPDVIHTHLFEAEIVSRSCYYPKVKWISHCHSNIKELKKHSITDILLSKEKLIYWFERKYLIKRYHKNGGNIFIAISKHTLDYFKKNMPLFEVSFLPNAIDFKKFKRISHTIPRDKLRLINVGSFQDKKNQKFLIDVAKILKSKTIDFELHFLGIGKNKTNIERKVKEEALEKEVIFHGNVNDVEEYLWKSNLYVHSATYEPMGLVLIEAMAAGLPVICLDGLGNRDLIKNGENGYLFKEENVIEFSEKILEIFNHKEEYTKMSEYAIKYAQKFDIVNYTSNLVKTYKLSLNDK